MKLEVNINLSEDQLAFFLDQYMKMEGRIRYQKGQVTRLNRRCDQIEELWRDQDEPKPKKVRPLRVSKPQASGEV